MINDPVLFFTHTAEADVKYWIVMLELINALIFSLIPYVNTEID